MPQNFTYGEQVILRKLAFLWISDDQEADSKLKT